MNHIVVVGAGLTAANAIEELRTQGHSGPITLIGAEEHLPYERPPLSKGLLLGSDEVDSVFVHDRPWYLEQEVELRLGSPATAIDPSAKTVSVAGDPIAYDALLLATGSSARRLPLFDNSQLKVAYLRTLDESVQLKESLSGDIVIIGAGWIGLEFASAASQAGASVTIVENAPLPLLNAVGPEMGTVFADLHRDHGVTLLFDTSVTAVEGKEVTLSDGQTLRPDLVVVGVGATPNTELAESAGLAIDNGVLVDSTLRTTDPHIYAAGDLANTEHLLLGRIRVEHWDNAIEQGKHAARAMLGSAEPYMHLPYFYTDQYDLGMEYLGLTGPDGYDEVIIDGDIAERVLIAWWVRNGEAIAGMHLNDWDAIDTIRKVVRTGPVDLASLRDGSIRGT